MNARTAIAAAVALAATTLSATALASADAAPGHHQQAAARAGAYRVTASVNKSEALLNSRIKIKGSVRPAAPGARVTLQVRYEDRKTWKTIGSTTLSAAGKFRFKDKLGSVRVRKYRVVKTASPGHAGGHSKSLKVTVFGWRDLTSLSPANYSGFTEVDNGVKMNGVAYPDSLRSYTAYPGGSPSTIAYNLNRDCKSFKGVAGLVDSSPQNGSATISMSTDGTVRYTGVFALTQAAPVAFDVTNVFRLTVSATLTGGTVAVGTPQVLCSF